MLTGLVFAVSLLLEMVALLTIWHWSIRGRTILALIVASLLVLMPIVAGTVIGQPIPARAYLAFAGTYIFSGLIWSWWKDGIGPDRWGAVHFGLAIVSVGMFSLANSAWDQT